MNEAARAGEESGSDLIARHHELVLRLVRTIARTHRLSVDETDELRSLVHLKLVESNGLVFRRFAGRSSLSTYLTKVIWRVYLDRRTAAWGRWRPSAQARRQGATAIRLERLLDRDGVPFDEACSMLLGSGRANETRESLERMRDSFPSRLRVRVCGQDVLEALQPAALPFAATPHDEEELAAREALHRKLATALVSLPRDDRRLLRMRYRDGWTIARVASELRLNPKRTYREYERVHRTLRAMLSGATEVLTPGRSCQPA